MADNNSLSIGAVAKRTGLTPSTIRIWEARYDAVTPTRSSGGQRRYSMADVRRLELLKLLVDRGQRIGLAAKLDQDELEAQVESLTRPPLRLVEGDAAAPSIAEAVEAVGRMDRVGLRKALEEAALRMGRVEMLDEFMAPLMKEIGDRCASGALRMSHEHMASAEIRGFLDSFTGAVPPPPDAPNLVVGTPAWQFHELGSLVVAATARAEGWNVTYLGPNLPASEIASASIEVHAAAVALSITYVDDRERLLAELETLSRLAGPAVVVIAGGRGAQLIGEQLEELGITQIHRLPEFRRELHRIQTGLMAG